MNKKSLVFALLVVLVCCSCAWFGKKPSISPIRGEKMETSAALKASPDSLAVTRKPGITVTPLNQFEMSFVTEEVKKGGPALLAIPSPFSNIIYISFYLPFSAQIRFDLLDHRKVLVDTLINEFTLKGAYNLGITRPYRFPRTGEYSIQFLVDSKIMGTKTFPKIWVPE